MTEGPEDCKIVAANRQRTIFHRKPACDHQSSVSGNEISDPRGLLRLFQAFGPTTRQLTLFENQLQRRSFYFGVCMYEMQCKPVSKCTKGPFLT